MKELLIQLDADRKIPLYEQICRFLKEEIRRGKIPPGEKLPSARALAAQLSVSRSTVDLAYGQLTSEGYLNSVPCRGYFVGDVSELYRLEHLEREPVHKRQADAPAFRYDFALNGIDEESFPINIWRKISREVLLEENSALFQLGDPEGEWSLRTVIAEYLHHARGVNCRPEQIVMGAGNDYLVILLSLLLGRDIRIAMENPTYRSAWNCFRSLGHSVAAVPLDEAGMDVERLEESGASAAYVMPSHQFPMGTVMPIRRRLQLLQWAAGREGRFLIEDDYDSEFRYRGKPIPALQGYDTHDCVIYLGTFSKAIAPGIRVSYMVLPERLLPVYRERASVFSATISRIDQSVLEIFLREGHFERHLNRMRAVYKAKHDLLVKNLRELSGILEVSGEHAGVHLLVHFRNGITEQEAIARAASAGIRVYGLSEYIIGEMPERGRNTVLLGYGPLRMQEIEEACRTLKQAWSALDSEAQRQKGPEPEA